MPGAAHTRVRCNGVLGPIANPYEIFSYGFSLSLGGGVALATQAPNIAAKVAAYHSRPTTLIHSTAHLTEVAVSSVGANGVQVGDTVRVAVAADGGSGANPFPPQVAYRVSLQGPGRGRSQRGGWYVPMPAVSLTASDPRLAAADALGAANSAKTLYNDLFGLANSVSIIIGSSVDGNVSVKTIRVGRVLDTIRSRRNAMPEDYAAVPTTP